MVPMRILDLTRSTVTETPIGSIDKPQESRPVFLFQLTCVI